LHAKAGEFLPSAEILEDYMEQLEPTNAKIIFNLSDRTLAAWLRSWHGGKIRVDSKLGEGTVVTVTLPIRKGIWFGNTKCSGRGSCRGVFFPVGCIKHQPLIFELPMSRDNIHAIAHLHARPYKGEELSSLLTSLLEPTRRELGCIRFELWQTSESKRFCNRFTMAK
jgi:hypothetical protein